MCMTTFDNCPKSGIHHQHLRASSIRNCKPLPSQIKHEHQRACYTRTKNQIYFRKSSTMTVPSLQHPAILVPDLFQSISKMPPGAVYCFMGAAVGVLTSQMRRVSSKDPEAMYWPRGKMQLHRRQPSVPPRHPCTFPSLGPTTGPHYQRML